MIKKLTQFFKNEEGATAVEYGIMVALIAVVIIVAVTAVGDQLVVVFNQVAAALGFVAPAG
jgi:pilus assembly protein Flp/PilA